MMFRIKDMKAQANWSMMIKIIIFVVVLFIGIAIMKKPEIFSELIDNVIP